MSRWFGRWSSGPALLLLGGFLVSLGENECRADWIIFQDCRYLPNRANDGDSFHVRAEKKEYIFRLYFVDAPETHARFRSRLRDQARYFHVTIPQALRIGREAERFTKRKLRRPFTVRTCLQDARGRSRLPRYFAFVEIAGNDLGEMLVANGLARVFGAAAEAPGKNRPEVEWRRLEQLERQAKMEKIGGWAMTLERSSVGTNGKNRASSGD
jgi:endonuclease YncB( thermonuclease family)